jgi:hypothetical protein
MSKILKSIVGLVIISSTIGLAAAPAKAESKPAQCQRFGQALVTFSQQLKSAAQRDPNQSYSANMDRLLSGSEQALKQLQSRKFSDPKIRGFQQNTLNIMTRFHNNIIDASKMAERHDRPATDRAVNKMMADLQPLEQMAKQANPYCGWHK